MVSKKIRVHELAKELNLDNNKVILQFLEDKGISGKTASSGLDEEHVNLVKNNFSVVASMEVKKDKISTSKINPSNQKSRNESSNDVENNNDKKNKDTISQVKQPSVSNNDISNSVLENKPKNEDNEAPQETKTSISNSIKERMAQKTQSLKDKFSSRSGLKAKLESRKDVQDQETDKDANTSPVVEPQNNRDSSSTGGGYQGRSPNQGSGGYQNRDSSSTGGGYQGRSPNQGSGGYQNRDSSSTGGGYQGRSPNQGSGGYQNRDSSSTGGGYQGRSPNQGSGGYQNRDSSSTGGGYQGRSPNQGSGGYQNRDSSSTGGGYQGRSPNQGSGGYQNRDSSSTGGGYQGRSPNQGSGGYQNRDSSSTGGGYQGRSPNQGSGGYQNRDSSSTGGGYQGRSPNQGSGGYQNRDSSSTGGGYQGRSPNQGSGGYQNRDSSSTGGGYQGRSPNQGSGGYQNRDSSSTGGGYQGQNPNPAGTGGYQNRTDGGYKAPVKLFTINDKNKSTTGFDPNDPKKPRTQPFDNKKSFGLPVKSDGTAPEAGKKRPDNKKKDASAYKKKSIEEERLLAKASINKRKKKEEKKEEVVEENLNKEIEIFDGMNVKDVADKLRIKETDIIRELFMKKMMVTVNQSLDLETIEKIVLDHGFTIKAAVNKDDEILEQKLEELMAEVDTDLVSRPPVVTIMGHVDHGKTSLLDSIRKTKITEGEAGGITQHIGAYQVHVQDRLITFLDTPGHEAFTAMRARGARSTDIAVLVVAADDGIMPQTIEAINHAKAASVPIIVAINKMDKVDANPDRVKQQLAEHDLVPEDWGGTTVTVPVSARAKTGIDDLLDMIILTADIQDIKSNPNKPAQGVIIESKLDKGKGAVATVLIQAGTLKIGDNFVVGTVYGKVRAMFDYLGKQVKQAALSAPVQVIGYSAVPVAGETFKVVGSDKEAREIAEKALELEKEKSLSPVRAVNLESISEQIGEGKVKELNLVVKADVQGSYEALAQSLMKISVEDVKLRIIHSAVGDVTENDITLAAASSGIVVAFNVKIEPKARDMAEKELVDIRSYNIIYRVIEDVQKALEGLLEPELEEVLTGKAEVRAIFTVGKTSVVAGCYVLEGKIARNSTIKLIRDGQTIHTGKIDTLKRFKDDVKEVSTGFEFGISLEKSNDIKEKDIMEAYVMQAKPRN